jgi:hypothetical protein
VRESPHFCFPKVAYIAGMTPKKNSRRSGQKLELHGQGVAGFTRGDIERRAKELAEIDNRMEITNKDRDLARAEFLDRDLPAATTEDAETMQSLSRDPSDPPTNRGEQVPEYGDPDEETSLQRLALEGVEEAQHEQMTASRAIEEPFRSRPKRKGPPDKERAEAQKV